MVDSVDIVHVRHSPLLELTKLRQEIFDLGLEGCLSCTILGASLPASDIDVSIDVGGRSRSPEGGELAVVVNDDIVAARNWAVGWLQEIVLFMGCRTSFGGIGEVDGVSDDGVDRDCGGGESVARCFRVNRRGPCLELSSVGSHVRLICNGNYGINK